MDKLLIVVGIIFLILFAYVFIQALFLIAFFLGG